ncbi:hypothetical protein NPIL_212952 [Nephila pilipes]|uniref:SAM domain-containing protein n=1 Tax=Nephila pilipes TaxID=299642 RepID=A0A8X6UJY6_NEPPI|nr:hypothetical protein NPIL_212952 [Nephila pilipes]
MNEKYNVICIKFKLIFTLNIGTFLLNRLFLSSTAIQSLDSLNEEIVQVFLSSQSDGNLSEDPVIAARWSHQCHYSMVLMRRLLIDAQGKFRKMMSDNQALASRIDQDIQSAHLQVSALRAELADTNQRIKDICSESMAGNVITTCMPPTSTTNTTTVISTADGHWLKDTKQGHPVTESTVKVSKVCSSPPIADKGGTKSPPPADLPESSSQRLVQSPKSGVSQNQKVGEQKTNLVNGSSPDQSVKSSKDPETVKKEQNNLDKVSDEVFSGIRHFSHDGSDRPQVPPKQVGLTSKGSKDLVSKETKVKSENLIENSKPTEEMSVSKHKSHRRERRSLKGSDVQKSILEDLKSQQSNNSKTDDSKSELQRSESDGNQNSAPECDLSISGSPFKEDISKVASEDSMLCSSSSLKSSPRKNEPVDDGSKRDDFSLDFHRSSPPVKDESNAQCFPLLKDSTEIFLQKDSTNGHRYKAKTKSDPLDKRRDKCAQEFSVLSSPSSVMRHKTGVSKLQLGICNWENRPFEHKDPWYKTQDNSSSMSGKSLMSESSSKEETSDSQDGIPPDFCDQRPIRDENKGGRFVVFDSKNREPFRDWRTTLSESYRDQQTSDSWKNSSCVTVEQKDVKTVDEKRQAPEKDQSIGGLIQESSYYRKPENLEYSPYNSTSKSQDEAHLGEVEALKIKNSALLRDLEEVMESRDEKAKENAAMASKLEHMDKELKHAKEALSALKQDRKRLKAEKFDLLTQMKQLYSTLEDKEEELREFIRNYEQKMKESDENMKQMAKEREEMEQERWNILKRARDEAERAVLLCTQLGLKDAHIKELQEEISILKEKRLSSSHDTRQSNGFGSPGSMSYRTANGIDSRGTPTPTPGSDPTTSPSYAGTPTISMQYVDPMSPRKGAMIQTLSPDHRPTLLSRSAEDIFNSAGIGELNSVKKKSKEKKGTWGSISRVFSRSKKRKPLDPELFENHRSSWSPKESVCSSPLNEESYVQKLRLLEETHGTPMQHWRAATVLAWLEITMDMPQYGAACAENIKSGKLLLELSDSELEEGLGITNVMHRRKLRLAIEEHRQPSLCRYPKICLMTHSWIVEEWLPSIALTCYLPSFSEHLVDGRVLDTLTKKDLEKHFGISRKFHQLSIMHAIQLLRMLNFDRQILNQRRMNSENMDIDPLVWTNLRLIKWAASIDLGEYAENLKGTGVHGALAVLEPSFTADTIATALGIPTSKNIIRRHLTTEWQNLIQPARLSLESESMVSKKSKSEKRLASGSSSISLVSQGRSSSSIMPSYARRTLDRYDRRRSSWRESLRSLTSKKTPPVQSTAAERPHLLPLSPKLNTTRHRRTFSSHSDVETLTVTPV